MTSTLTPTELRKLSINAAVATEAYQQGTKRLEDILDTKKNFEQKAFTLLSGYLATALALAGFAISSVDQGQLTLSTFAYLSSSVCLAIGGCCFLMALRVQQYGFLGMQPEIWLQRGVIDGPDKVIGDQLAYCASELDGAIDVSIASNITKDLWITRGMKVGIASPISALITLLFLCLTRCVFSSD